MSESRPCPQCGRYHPPGACLYKTEEKNTFSESKEINGKFEFDPETGITKHEEDILEKLTPETIEKIRFLKTDNLYSKAKKIVAIRSEDILYLIQSIERGYFSTSPSPLRGKILDGALEGSDPAALYATPNPESQLLRDTFADFEISRSTLKKIIHDNLRSYSEIAIVQAIYRNVWMYIKDQEKMKKEIGKLYELGVEQDWENFFTHLVHEIVRGEIAQDTRSFVSFLLAHLDVSKIDKGNYRSFVKTLPQRGGVVLGIDEEALKKFKTIHSGHKTSAGFPVLEGFGDEVAFVTPDQKFPTDLIVGFEVLGNFEDEILDHLGID